MMDNHDLFSLYYHLNDQYLKLESINISFGSIIGEEQKKRRDYVWNKVKEAIEISTKESEEK